MAAKQQNPSASAPEATTNNALETATAAESSPVVKRGWQKVRAEGFAGNYKGNLFDDEGVCPRIDEHVLADLRADYPNLKITEID